MVSQTEFSLRPRPRGCHLVTDEILAQLPPLPRAGLLHLFLQHTSAALTINENADPDVCSDMASVLDRLIREREPYYAHTLEGDDDMPAHAKSTLAGVSLTIPITAGRLNLGLWQGVYLCEFRIHGGALKSLAPTCRKGGSFEAGTASEPADFRSTPGSDKARERRVRPPKQRARPQPGHLCRSRSADRHKTVRNHLFIKKIERRIP